MAEEVVSLRASGGHLGVTRLRSLSSLPARIHCKASHEHCLNYISRVAVVRGVKRKRRHGGTVSEWGLKKKRAGVSKKWVFGYEFWTAE